MFRKRRAVKQLTADELKTKLYSHFDKSGSLNRMRTELRGNLVSELLKIAAPLENTSVDEAIEDFDRALLPLQVSNWLVYDHLLRQGHQYALSIFVTEANLSQPEKLLTGCDILHLFGLDSSTPEYKSISKMYSADNDRGRFHSLLLAVIKSLFDFREDKAERDIREVKPEESSPFKYAGKPVVIQSKVNEYQMEERSKDRPKSRNDNRGINEHARGNERSGLKDQSHYNDRSESDDRLRFAIEEKEREVLNLRQKLLQELDRMYKEERSLQMDVENEKLELKKERDAFVAKKDKLREKELLMNKEFENKLERKIRELETDFTSKVHSKDKTLEDLQRKLSEKEQKLSQLEVDFTSQRSSCEALRKELEDMRNLCKSVQEKYSALLDDNTNLLRKFESMSDYTVVKGELETKSQQLSSLRREIQEFSKISEKEKGAMTEIVRNLEMQLKEKESGLVEARRQLNTTRDTLHMEEAVWSKERRKLEQETLASRDMYKTFIHRLEEQKDDIQALHQTIHLLHYQLTEKNSKPEPFTHSKVPFNIPEVTRNEPEVFRISRNVRDSPPKYRDSSLKFIEDAKSRIGRLQKEADALQDKCSFVYGSVPELSSSYSVNPPTFNANMQSDIKKFSSNLNYHFDNLIGNEMPILDLSLPDNIRSKFGSVFTDAFVPKTIGTNIASGDVSNPLTGEAFRTEVNKVARTNDTSQVSQQLIDTEDVRRLSNESAKQTEKTISQSNIKDGLLEYTKTSSDVFNSGTNKITSSVTLDPLRNPEITNAATTESSIPQSSNLKDILPEYSENYRATGAIPKKTYSWNSLTSQKSEHSPSTVNIPKTSTKEFITNEDYFLSNQSKELGCDFQSNTISKDYFPPIQSEHSGDIQSKTTLSELNQDTSKKGEELENKSSDDFQTKSGFEELKHNEAVGELVPKLDKNTSKLVPDVAQNLVPKVANVSEPIPVVIDLDAAWKRKSSLVPSDPPLQFTGALKLPALEKVSKPASNLNTEHVVETTQETSPRETIDFPEYNSAINVSNIQLGDKDIAQNVPLESSINSPIKSNLETLLGNSPKETSKNKISSPTHVSDPELSWKDADEKVLTESSRHVLHSTNYDPQLTFEKHDVKTAGVIRQDVLKDRDVELPKIVPDDSLSELSEVHLSCGSEQEQQKEDSDNW